MSDLGKENDINKYIALKNKKKRNLIYSLIASVVLMISLIVSFKHRSSIFLTLINLFIINMCILIFNGIIYSIYKDMSKGENTNRKPSWKSKALLSIAFLGMGTFQLISGEDYAVISIFAGVCNIFLCVRCYKECKKVS